MYVDRGSIPRRAIILTNPSTVCRPSSASKNDGPVRVPTTCGTPSRRECVVVGDVLDTVHPQRDRVPLGVA